ncbi:MAG: amidohydrolase [Clostridia bacterium]|nr:amidohydrolase [Clostridia bacterium]
MTENSIPAWLETDIDSLREELFAFRHDLHQYPELSGKEIRTAGKIRDVLRADDIPFREVRSTGTLGRIEGANPGPVILLRADIDALPVEEKSRAPFPSRNSGCAHACGHDIHTAALLGAARILQKHRDSLHGTIRLIFQQAEEFGHGSQYFLPEADVMEGAQRIYGFHVTPEAPLGSVILTRGVNAASCDHMLIRLYGKNTHIARPHLGQNALLAAADIVLHLEKIRNELDPLQSALIGVGRLESGNTWNVIPGYAELEGTIRTLSMDTRDALIREVSALAEKTASLYGVRAETEIQLHNPCLVNDDNAYENMRRAAVAAVAKTGKVLDRPVPLGFAGDDFGAYSQIIPGCMAHVGTAVEGEDDTSLPLHNDRYYIHDEAILTGVRLLVLAALQPL